MAPLTLRDRDAIVSAEGMIFRVYGYWHPPVGYVCDLEYAPSTIYKSENPRAFRMNKTGSYFKFYEHDGLEFTKHHYPRYQVYYEPTHKWLVGIHKEDIVSVRYPHIKLSEILSQEPPDTLIQSLSAVLNMIISRSTLKAKDFGVFGSILHGFYHPKYSDLDFTIIGKKKLSELLETLEAIYKEKQTLINEFDSQTGWEKKFWKFRGLTLSEYAWHQRRKLIYGILSNKVFKRPIKVEFEPVKNYNEITNEYDSNTRIRRIGWIEAYARVLDDIESPFIPSIYEVKVESARGAKVENIRRVVSYVEEFRMQAKKDERVYVTGNLERVSTPSEEFYQITLTYGPRYYEQTLKVINSH